MSNTQNYNGGSPTSQSTHSIPGFSSLYLSDPQSKRQPDDFTHTSMRLLNPLLSFLCIKIPRRALSTLMSRDEGAENGVFACLGKVLRVAFRCERSGVESWPVYLQKGGPKVSNEDIKGSGISSW